MATGIRAKDKEVKEKIENARGSARQSYFNYQQYKRMDKADPSGALKAKVKSGSRHDRKVRTHKAREMAKQWAEHKNRIGGYNSKTLAFIRGKKDD